MNEQEIRSKIDTWVKAQNADDLDGVINSYAPDGCRVHNGVPTCGRDELRKTYGTVWKALTHRTMTIQHLTICGNTAVMEYTEHVTHAATVASTYGELAGSGKQFTIHGCGIMEYGEEGIKELRVYSNALFHMLALSKGLQPDAH
ncbi:MAG TPA: nuclear transport factor 2 family protein [Candidatus Dormibacteraeota bacterium]|jgi:uncharacterized protein (TIGR02246 family)